MTTYKSEMIEFRAGRIVLTEAQWTANTNVYPEGVIAITSDGANAGRTKVFDGTSYWSQLAYNSGGGGGAVTSDDVSDESILADPPGRPLTETLDAISQTFSDITTAITAVSTALTAAVSIDGTGGAQIMVFTGDTDNDGRLELPNLTALTPPVTSAVLIGSARLNTAQPPLHGAWLDNALAAPIVQFYSSDDNPAASGRSVSVTLAVTR